LIVTASSVSSDGKNGLASADSSPKLEIAFTYHRQSGMASNQFAIWIEDSTGRHIKTLYATRFTAQGGWKDRPSSLSRWVKAANPDTYTDQQIDAISGATPDSGHLVYIWDGLDRNGNRVPSGEYRFIVAANLRWNSKVLFSGIFDTGDGAQNVMTDREFCGGFTAERNMIANLTATYYPSRERKVR
jgi:hypothetical protein